MRHFVVTVTNAEDWSDSIRVLIDEENEETAYTKVREKFADDPHARPWLVMDVKECFAQ